MNKLKDINKIILILQEGLEDGWKKFKEDPLFDSYVKFREMLEPFYASELRNVIPHPLYQLSAQEIGKPFMIKARELELSFDEIFPGNFSESEELDDEENEVRQFKLTMYRNGQRLGKLVLSFPHEHDTFDFPSPPTIGLWSGI